MPNGPAQERVIREALASADLKPGMVGYLECHGTGTSLGDPIEVGALGGVFAANHDADKPLLIGSVKTNIGHLEAAAGVAGVIKVILALRHRIIPPHLHFNTPNPHIDWANLPFVVPTTPTPWQAIEGTRIAGGSSFGVGGTNAHAILEQAPTSEPAAPTEAEGFYLLPVSARSKTALRAMAERYRDRLREPGISIADLCHSAIRYRALFDHRLAVVAESAAEMADHLDGWLESGAAADHPDGLAAKLIKPAFLFTGQGSQYGGMGQQLYQREPVFRETLDRCAAILDKRLPRPMLEVMFEPDGQTIHDTAYTQPLLFAYELALAELWRARGITPGAVLGHSVGEIAAACFAGVLDLEDGLTLIAATWSHGGPLYYQEFSIPPNRREMLVSDEEA